MRSSILPLFLLISLLPACIGSRYKQPKPTMPRSFTYTGSMSEKEPIVDWWTQFHDPVLNALIERAVHYSYNLQIAQEQIEEARALYQIQDARLYPEIDAIAQVRRLKFSKALPQTSSFTNSHSSFFQLGTDAFWELDFWGRLRHERDAQYYAFQAQIEQMHDVYIILIAEVAARYIDLCALSNSISLLEEKIAVEEKLVVLQQDLYTAGLADEITVMQQQQLLESTRNQLEQQQIARIQVINQLAILLGAQPEQIKIKQVRNSVPLSQYKIEVGIPSDLLRRRPDIRQAERQIASTHELVSAAIAEWFPRFTLLGGATSEASKGSTWFKGNSLSWFIGPSVRWPIINFGRIKANIHVQESRKRQALLAYSNTVITALQDVEDFLVAYCYTNEQLTILTRKYHEARMQEQLVGSKYQAGLDSVLTLLQAQDNRITVQLELVQIRQALSSALVGLYKALGGGW